MYQNITKKQLEGLKVTNTSTYAKVITHYYIQNPDGTLTANKVPTKDGDVNEDTVQEGNLGDSLHNNTNGGYPRLL